MEGIYRRSRILTFAKHYREEKGKGKKRERGLDDLHLLQGTRQTWAVLLQKNSDGFSL